MKVLAQAKFETLTILRHGEQAVLNIVLPLVALVILARVPLPTADEPLGPSLAYASALALAWASTAFTAQAIAVAFDRRWGVLRMLSTTPLGPSGLFGGKLLAVGLVGLIEAVLLGITALILGAEVNLAVLLQGLGLGLTGLAAFLALGLLLGGSLRPEAVLAIGNLAWALMAGFGGILIPLSAFPTWWATIAFYTPPGALGQGMRALAGGEGSPLVSIVILLGWAIAGSVLTVRFFRWDSK